MLFGGGVVASGSLLAVFTLRELGLTPAQYGLALGLPAAGGILGSLLTPHLIRRYGERRVLLGFGTFRAVGLLFVPLAPAGWAGLALIVLGNFLMLFAAGIFNPTFMTYRMNATQDEYMARVATAWSVSSRVAQPLAVTLFGALAAGTNLRLALLMAGSLTLSSVLLLPWRQRAEEVPSKDRVE